MLNLPKSIPLCTTASFPSHPKTPRSTNALFSPSLTKTTLSLPLKIKRLSTRGAPTNPKPWNVVTTLTPVNHEQTMANIAFSDVCAWTILMSLARMARHSLQIYTTQLLLRGILNILAPVAAICSDSTPSFL